MKASWPGHWGFLILIGVVDENKIQKSNATVPNRLVTPAVLYKLAAGRMRPVIANMNAGLLPKKLIYNSYLLIRFYL